MNVSLNWLSDYVDFGDYSVDQLDDLLTFAGVEVEGISRRGVPSELIVVAEVKEAVQHENADKLKVCMVDAGEAELRQIVCGAKNYKVGDKVPCALPGADLGGGFVIKEGKLRGVASRGMLCAAGEIGLVDEVDGLMILDDDAEVGKPLVEMFAGDTVIEVEVTPNRPDLLSHMGMARELSALTGRELRGVDVDELAAEDAGDFVTLNAVERCPFYAAVKITGVKVGESPGWLKERLESIGLKPINNVVDVTNYVLHELGHPLHAFDAAKVEGGLEVRLAEEGEKFDALDGGELELTEDDLVISDAGGNALALAGVMGGAESGVCEGTTDVILESAYFVPSFVRRTSRRTGLSSDSSYRFERGTDPQAVLRAASRAAALICEVAGGKVEGGALVAGEAPQLVEPVRLDLAKLDQLMGGSISTEEAKGILAKLGLEEGEDDVWKVPSYRLDLERHIDLVEEIARVHGLDKVASRFGGTFVEESDVDRSYDFQMGMKRRLAALGFYEAQTIKLIAESSNDVMVAQMCDALPVRPLQEGDLIRVALPLSEDHAVMRPSLIPGLVAVAARNIRQGRRGLRFFEMGRQFRNAGGGKARDLEAESVAILLGGDEGPENWARKAPDVADLYDLKAVVGELVGRASVQFRLRERDGFILAGDVLADGKPVGAFGQLSPARCREIDALAPIYVAELELAKLEKLAGVGGGLVEELAQFPGSSRDAAMEVPVELENSAIEAAIGKHNEPLLVGYSCFDVFVDPSGERLAADKKSVGYRFEYRLADRTLKAKEVDAAHQRLLDHLAKSLGVGFR